MQYSPKLKKAMEEIKAIVNKYDIGAIICLHTPGFREYMQKVDPSYSALKFKPDGSGYNVLGKASHYGGDKHKRDEMLANTKNMIENFVESSGIFFMTFDEISKDMEAVWGKWDSEAGNHTSHNQQNN
jgi:hypothetical protein